MRRATAFVFLATLLITSICKAHVGYYRYPSIHGDTIVFAAEGDLWVVGDEGGPARRLTTHHGEETHPAISPDGGLVAYCGQYEGQTEVYTIPIEGGVPTRRTYGAERLQVIGWSPSGELLYRTRNFSTAPNRKLVALDLQTGDHKVLPLHQAAGGAINEDGVLAFTRLPFQGSHAKRYKGGTARTLWKFSGDMAEAEPLAADYEGESLAPMWWKGRIYHLTDRDGTMNIWSMKADGTDLKQHTRYKGWDVKSPSLSDGRIVYQLGADLYLFDIKAHVGKPLPISLTSDLDQMRERWVTSPMDYLTAAHPSADGERVVLTARGEVFVTPAEKGRMIHLTRDSGVRYREAHFLAESESILALSDESGEVELWTLPADGLGDRDQLTDDGTILRFGATPSPDGRWVVYQDKNWELWLYDNEDKTQRMIAKSEWEVFADLRWSPDSNWLAYVERGPNTFAQIKLQNVGDGRIVAVTTDRVNSYSPAWSPDGKWLYFLSDRHFESPVMHVWSQYQAEPYLHRMTKLYVVSLTEERRSPFLPMDELEAAKVKAEEKKKKKEEKEKKKTEDLLVEDDEAKSEPSPEGEPQDASDGEADVDEEGEAASEEEAESEEEEELVLDLEGIKYRAMEVPVGAGNYRSLSATEKHLYWIASNSVPPAEVKLQAIEITNKDPEVKTVADDVRSYELTADRKKMLLRKGAAMHMVKASGGKADLNKNRVDLSRWRFPFDPREEWRQMFIEAWRLERDYFYDPSLHSVEWEQILDKCLPLVDRVTTRAELSDLISQMVGELSALHTAVVGGDHRSAGRGIQQGAMGARLTRDNDAGGYRIDHIYKTDPDYPDRLSPLAQPHLDIHEGDVIAAVNGIEALSVPDIGFLLRDQAGAQVRLHILDSADEGEGRDVIIKPISTGREYNLRYDEWEYTRRKLVEEWSDGQIGYFHMRAMGGGNYFEFARNFYPVFNRKGLVVDVRHNTGGNIESWILEKLMRRAWMYWKGRAGRPTWNMQYAFRGHMAALCNEYTMSDGETFIEGFKRLELGKTFGTRTWGGGIWLTFSNRLVDHGIASAAEFASFGPEGQWIIEMSGTEPDVTIDNLPHATFNGEDAQLRAAVDYLLKRIAEDPRDVPEQPQYPDKSFGN